MQLTYIFHSGFALETDRCILVFDYWMDPAGVMPRLLQSPKPLYVFSSHFHEDHFNRDIFSWRTRKNTVGRRRKKPTPGWGKVPRGKTNSSV